MTNVADPSLAASGSLARAAPSPSLLPAFGPRSLAYLAVAAALTVFGIVSGASLTDQSMLWYQAILRKPWFNPPNFAFPIAWSLLYLLMAYAFWRILRAPAATPGRASAIAAFCLQLSLNVAWSWLFFGNQDPASALVEVFAFEAAILWMIASFRQVDRIASVLMWPYAAWVAFATVLNATIVAINPVFPTLWNRL